MGEMWSVSLCCVPVSLHHAMVCLKSELLLLAGVGQVSVTHGALFNKDPRCCLHSAQDESSHRGLRFLSSEVGGGRRSRNLPAQWLLFLVWTSQVCFSGM